MNPLTGHQNVSFLAGCDLAKDLVKLADDIALLLVCLLHLNFFDATITSFGDLDCEVHHQEELKDHLA